MSSLNSLSARSEGGQDEGISDLDKILRNLELENKQEARLLEKEKQQIIALERSINEKQEGIQKIEDDLCKFDEDAKTLHRQFRQNKDNAESLRKHADVVSCHGDALETKLLQMQEKHAFSRKERSSKLEHYRSIWNNYSETYESSPQAKVWRACHEEVEAGVRNLMEQAETVQRLKEAIQEIETNLRKDAVKEDWRAWIIEIAKIKLSSSSLLKEIDEVKKRNEALREEIKEANQEIMKKAAIESAASQMQNGEEMNQPSSNSFSPAPISTSATSLPASSQPVPNSDTKPVPNLQTPMPNSPAPVPNSSHPRVPRLFFPSPASSSQKTASHGTAVCHLPPQPSPSRYIQIPQLPQRNKVVDVVPPLPHTSAGRVSTLPSAEYYQIPRTSSGSSVDVTSAPTVLRNQSHTDSNLQGDTPMETDSEMVLTPKSPAAPKTPTTEEDGLSASQVREKLLSLEKSPGFQYSFRPMYNHDEEMPASPSPAARAHDTSNPFFSNIFGGQMTSHSPASTSAISMFGNQGEEESSDGNIMSLFASGPPSQEDQSDSQEVPSFSLNFSSTPSASEPESAFSLF
ncbi:hypothetical protein HOLleu_39137 [Holothuria leucospilota]|uniref:Uncharacterized protein n=1 Tax=Holothuria leucospilota TaxID=206669 RepID=A0A9Q1BBK0_HOLLE|nr:hypothetical protein HOLleu_39137 [Holothuria leucospilota]